MAIPVVRDFNKWVKARVKEGEPLTAIASRLGMTTARLYQLREGQGSPSLDTAFRIERETGIPASAWLS